LNVQAIAERRDLLADQDRTAIAEGREVAELVTGVRLRDRSPPAKMREHPPHQLRPAPATVRPGRRRAKSLTARRPSNPPHRAAGSVAQTTFF
jgi:hypothetical protein